MNNWYSLAKYAITMRTLERVSILFSCTSLGVSLNFRDLNTKHKKRTQKLLYTANLNIFSFISEQQLKVFLRFTFCRERHWSPTCRGVHKLLENLYIYLGIGVWVGSRIASLPLSRSSFISFSFTN